MLIIIYLLLYFFLIFKRSCLSLLIQNSSHDRLLLCGRSGILWSDRSAGSRHGGLRGREHRARHAGRNHFIPLPLLDLYCRSCCVRYLMCFHRPSNVILIGYLHLHLFNFAAAHNNLHDLATNPEIRQRRTTEVNNI